MLYASPSKLSWNTAFPLTVQAFLSHAWIQCSTLRKILCKYLELLKFFILSVPNLSSCFELAANSRSDIEREDNWKLLSDHCHTTGSRWDQSTGCYQLNRCRNQKAEENDEEVGGGHAVEETLECYSRWWSSDGKAKQDCSLWQHCKGGRPWVPIKETGPKQKNGLRRNLVPDVAGFL